ncbi:unnamed protein product [Adineta steineri]|uniref:Polycystic kidney disease 2-like 1 protein n=1 Tax=Adineta steineri TaxID=433720 RepID=A0A813ZHK6_9BILA|nr:unnamed protein product [Adineta steineri]
MAIKKDARPISYNNSAFDDQTLGDKTSIGLSSANSDVFVVQSNGKKSSYSHSEPYGSNPVTQHRGFGRSILHGIRSLWATRQTEKDLGKDKDLYVKTTIRELIIYLAHSEPYGSNPVTQHRGFGRSILHGIRSLWATRQTEKDLGKDKDLYVKTTIRELIIYLAFVSILCIITFGMASSKTFYFTTVLRTILTERKVSGDGAQPAYDDIGSFDDFWAVMNEPVLKGLFNKKWYNNENLTADQSGYVLFENKILGLPRLRQLRVRNNSCVVHRKFQSSIRECYAPYSSSKEDRNSYGPENKKLLTTPSAWQHKTSSELNGLSSSGLISRYGGGGFVLDLTRDFDIAQLEIANLKTNLWLDRGTRVVFLDFTLYNANINLFCQIKLTVEFPAAGGAIPSKTFSTVKLIRYVSTMDYFVLACEILFIIFTVYYTVEEVLEITRFRLQYFKTIWNVLDVLIICISYVCIGFNVYRQVKVADILDELLNDQSTFADFEFLTYWQLQFNNIIAFTVFLAWIKIFKYVSFNKTMTQLSTTLSRCAKDVLGFSVMFMIVFLAYAQLGYLLFGTMVTDYKTFSTSIFTLFRIILGDFDFDAILDAHRILGPIFFLTYVFFVFFVLLNMFLAIINDTYAEVKNDMSTQESEFELGEYFKKSYGKVLERLHFKRDRVIDIQEALKNADINKDGVIENGQNMFLNDLSIYSIPLIGVILLIIGMGSFKTINLFKYQSSTKRRKYQYIDNDKNNLQNSHVAIQVNPFSQLNNIGSYQQYSTVLPLDDDDELIQSDISSISASIFCETSLIELRLDQDTEYDNDLADEDNN